MSQNKQKFEVIVLLEADSQKENFHKNISAKFGKRKITTPMETALLNFPEGLEEIELMGFGEEVT